MSARKPKKKSGFFLFPFPLVRSWVANRSIKARRMVASLPRGLLQICRTTSFR